MIKTVKEFIIKHSKTLIFFGITGLIGGFFTGLFVIDSYPDEMKQQIYDQGLNNLLLGVITALQAMGYGVILGAVGIFLGERVGLFKVERRLERKPLLITGAASVVAGLSLILFDLLWFGRVSEAIMESYAAKPTLAFILGAIIYGGVIEEVMLRLFLMSLIAFILHKIFGKGKEHPTVAIYTVANVLSAILFALAHLPATAVLLGITPLIVFRCLLLNGGIGVIFGWLYQRYGLRYSMIAHAGCHVVAKLIWIIFI